MNEKQGAADVTRKVITEKKGLIEENRNLSDENKKLHARVKFLERSVRDHQEVARERANAEDKAKEKVASLERENKQLEIKCSELEDKRVQLSLEIESCRTKLLTGCKAIQDSLHKMGARITLPGDENGLASLAAWIEESTKGLGDGVAPFAYRCSKTAVEALSSFLLSRGCDHFGGMKSSIQELLEDENKFNNYREAVRAVVKAFQILYWKKQGYEDTLASIEASLAANSQLPSSDSGQQGKKDGASSSSAQV